MYEAHGDEEEKAKEDKEDEEHDEEDAEEVAFGGSSPKHGVKPKLEGVPLFR